MLDHLPAGTYVVHHDGRDEIEILTDVARELGLDDESNLPPAILIAKLEGELIAAAPR